MGPSDFCIWTLVALLLTIFPSNVMAAGYFELQILEISNTNSHLLSGYCCGVPLDKKNGKTTGCTHCSTAFRLCLKEHQTTITPESGVFTGCSFGNASTSVLGGSSFVLSDPEVGTIVLPFSFSWTKSFTLILQAVDFYNATYPISEQLIEETSYSGLILPSLEWNTLDHIGKNARITYRIRVQCQTNYYNVTCQTFCRPRNEYFGHYTCSDKGSKVCLPGWQGTNCEKAICKPGCDSVHGKCDQPGECECRSGWRGPLCNECMVYPGCRHGYCNGSAWQCICDTNWGGILCDQDLNFCGTHEPCMHGGTCENTAPDQFRCTCADGLSGTRCEIVEHPCATLPCKNGGTCTLKNPGKYESSASQMEAAGSSAGSSQQDTSPNQPIVLRGMRGMSSMGKPSRPNEQQRDALGGGSTKMQSSNSQQSATGSGSNSKPNMAEFTCSCAPGWMGSTCEINIDECHGGPCENGGTCVDLVGGFRCECPPQWSGELCSVDVDECELNAQSALGPCINSDRCINMPGTFQCTCLNGWGGPICDKNIDDCVGQCKNGATCIDLVNSFHCACALGYTGQNCSEDIDECASSPCRNGGECRNLLGKFTCICPVGYSGTLCEEAKNHCAPSPCVEGKCLNTPAGYYCLCPPTRSGNQCEHIVPPCESPPCSSGCTKASNTSGNQIACNGHGKCEMAPNGMGKQCVCHAGFTGPYCQHNLNECSPNPCKNGGICADGDGDFSCECASGWSGKICTEIATQCQDGQCLNGGTCVSSSARKARCRCNTGWGGPFCADQVNECEGQPCHNGGSCESGPGWFRCVCARGFSGDNCRINVNECYPMPCLGGGTCKDGIGGFTCICPPGRKGNRCEILLSDPSSVCMNTSSLSPYIPLQDLEDKSDNQTVEFNQDDTNCNFCICKDHQPICSNLWCGLPNCFVQNDKANNSCKSNEVCLPNSQETCLSPPCEPRGDCRKFESSRSVAPPNIPVPTSCWPNQAILGELCARISILLETSRIPKKSSVEIICLNLRSVLAARIVRHSEKNILTPLLVLLCDIKNGTNDTIELTVSTNGKGPNAVAAVSEAVKLLGEILSRQKAHVKETLVSIKEVEAASLSAIVEVKVETALITTETQSSGVFVIASFVIAIIALCLGAFGALMWRKRISSRSSSGVNLSPQSQEEEKSNNLQNEENFRRYANPLKGSVSSLRGAMELSLSPAPEIATIGSLAGPSAVHRSQPLFPPCDNNEFNEKHEQIDNNQTTKSHRGSQILLYKAQNPDIRKNTMGSIENSHKDFGKRSINCQSMSPPVVLPVDEDVLTVHLGN